MHFQIDDFQDGQFNYEKYFTGYNDYAIKKLIGECYGDTGVSLVDDIYDQQKIVEIINKYGLIGKDKTAQDIDILESDLNAYKEKVKNIYIDSDKAQFLDFSIHLFDIDPVFSYTKFIIFFLVGNISILLLFEIIRHIFYYVVLGSLKPRK